jgi:hypothetical protein
MKLDEPGDEEASNYPADPQKRLHVFGERLFDPADQRQHAESNKAHADQAGRLIVVRVSLAYCAAALVTGSCCHRGRPLGNFAL